LCFTSVSTNSGQGYTKVWVFGFNGHAEGRFGAATFSQEQSVVALAGWLLEQRSIPEVNQLTECLWDIGVSAVILSPLPSVNF